METDKLFLTFMMRLRFGMIYLVLTLMNIFAAGPRIAGECISGACKYVQSV